ncbi:MAG: sensor histidine kinase, partial [Planctomycetota bacterium]
RKYGAGGGRIDVLVAPQPRALVVAVRDRGPGVPAAESERVFERFVRGEAHRHGSTPGVGIGLYLARTIVRRLGGELAVVSQYEAEALFAARAAAEPSATAGVAAHGPGACFVFRLPTETPA